MRYDFQVFWSVVLMYVRGRKLKEFLTSVTVTKRNNVVDLVEIPALVKQRMGHGKQPSS